jgi:hypothetical protein
MSYHLYNTKLLKTTDAIDTDPIVVDPTLKDIYYLSIWRFKYYDGYTFDVTAIQFYISSWEDYLNNSYWDIVSAVWSTDHWTNKVGGINDFLISAKPSWITEYRPSKLKISITSTTSDVFEFGLTDKEGYHLLVDDIEDPDEEGQPKYKNLISDSYTFEWYIKFREA